MAATPTTPRTVTLHTRRNATGWAISTDGRVYSNGYWYTNPGAWATTCTEREDELDAVIDGLTEDDALALIDALDQPCQVQALYNQARTTLQAAQAGNAVKLQRLQGTLTCSLAHSGAPLLHGYRNGGYRRYAWEITWQDLRGLVAGTHEFKYLAGTTRGRVALRGAGW